MLRSRILLFLVPAVALVALAVAVSTLAAQGLPAREPPATPPSSSAPPPAPASPPPESPGYAEKREPAPIESVEVRPDPAQPGHYLAHVVYGLPGGCARPGGYELHRDGDRIEIAVSIRLPTEPRPCTMIYGTSRYDVPLGELAAGRTYAVRVNDREVAFPPATAAPTPTSALAPAPSPTAATPAPIPTAATPAASKAIAPPTYLDDRSGPAQLLVSYANALNRKEYVRAYSYWRPAAASTDLPPFDQFAAGFSDTPSVTLTLGAISGDVGAGQLYYAVPVQLAACTTRGTTQTFVGCYKLHLARPQIQGAPPFQPLAIEGATVRQVGPNEDVPALLAKACEGASTGRPPPAP